MIHKSVVLTGQDGQNLKRLPAYYQVKGNKPVGTVLIGFAFLFGTESVYAIAYSLTQAFQDSPSVSPEHYVLAFVGMIFFFFGLNQFFIEGTLLLESNQVVCTYKNLLGRKRWCEDTDAYLGLQKKIRKGQSNSIGSQQIFYDIWLIHRRASKSLRLYSAWSDGEWDVQLQKYSAMFKLPILE